MLWNNKTNTEMHATLTPENPRES